MRIKNYMLALWMLMGSSAAMAQSQQGGSDPAGNIAKALNIDKTRAAQVRNALTYKIDSLTIIARDTSIRPEIRQKHVVRIVQERENIIRNVLTPAEYEKLSQLLRAGSAEREQQRTEWQKDQLRNGRPVPGLKAGNQNKEKTEQP
jgi:hypothetical protein